ncbi:MATE family efflux transporter [Acinetobacter lwoffii]|uniref:MATE family efflux transporter n=1 Tax=Acinetobacter lwoffii TaxID=28090 RepID=UPI001E4DFC31|nr:MATE family efflux transporter [Acinetobacter lwoffii]MDP1316169.1 MATE family efflux transporter [Acinetobacter lwoffii]
MKQFLHLWVPIFLSNAIIMLSSLFDVIFLSHFSPQHVAALAVCLSVYSLCFVTGIGVLQGMMQELAEANGRQDYADIQRIVKQSILIVLVISAVAMYLFNYATPVLHFLKADAALQALIVSCLWLLAWTIPAHLLLRILYILTQACGQAKRVFYANMIYLLLKVALALAYVLIYGIEGYVTSYGVEGAFMAHLIVQWVLLFVYYFFFLERKLKIQWSGVFFHWQTLLKILKIGLPNAVVTFVDVFAISAIALLILPLGDIVVNAYQVMLGLLGLMFMLPMSMASAFGILVSTKIGAEQIDAAWQLSKRALMAVMLIAIVVVLTIWGLDSWIVGLFSNDAQVIALALALILLMCWMHIFDALLVISLAMLRCWRELSDRCLFLSVRCWSWA